MDPPGALLVLLLIFFFDLSKEDGPSINPTARRNETTASSGRRKRKHKCPRVRCAVFFKSSSLIENKEMSVVYGQSGRRNVVIGKYLPQGFVRIPQRFRDVPSRGPVHRRGDPRLGRLRVRLQRIPDQLPQLAVRAASVTPA